jgi:hypothetical protein
MTGLCAVTPARQFRFQFGLQARQSACGKLLTAGEIAPQQTTQMSAETKNWGADLGPRPSPDTRDQSQTRPCGKNVRSA